MSAIDTTAFYDHLVGSGVELFTGVPDSLLQDLCAEHLLSLADTPPTDESNTNT